MRLLFRPPTAHDVQLPLQSFARSPLKWLTLLHIIKTSGSLCSVAPPLYGGADSINLTVVKFIESRGVEKPSTATILKITQKVKMRKFYKIRFLDFVFEIKNIFKFIKKITKIIQKIINFSLQNL